MVTSCIFMVLCSFRVLWPDLPDLHSGALVPSTASFQLGGFEQDT